MKGVSLKKYSILGASSSLQLPVSQGILLVVCCIWTGF